MTASSDLDSLTRRLFEEAVGHGEFGDDDNFFRIGGDSLTGLKITRQLGTELGRRVAMRVLFDNPTVSGLSAAAHRLAEETGGAR